MSDFTFELSVEDRVVGPNATIEVTVKWPHDRGSFATVMTQAGEMQDWKRRLCKQGVPDRVIQAIEEDFLALFRGS